MAITTRQQMIDYCLRALGAPVIEINVDPDQLEDRVDEALEYWRLYHPEGIESVYAKYVITASSLTLNGYSGSIQWESSKDNISFSPLSGENSATLSGTSIV